MRNCNFDSERRDVTVSSRIVLIDLFITLSEWLMFYKKLFFEGHIRSSGHFFLFVNDCIF